MVKDPKEADRCLKTIFPNLASDPHYKATSEPTDRYNCIAWAMRLTDRWVDLCKTSGHWWPEYHSGNYDLTRDGLISAFESLKFTKTDSPCKEFGYDKVALYYNPYTDGWSHAARILSEEEFHSKFGNGWDAHHGKDDRLYNKNNPNTYGHIYQYMKRPKVLRIYSFYLMAKFIYLDVKNLIKY